MGKPSPLPFADLLERVRAEYRATPGLQLTPSQATHRFNVEPSEGALVLAALVTEHFLFRSAEGVFRLSSPQHRAAYVNPS